MVKYHPTSTSRTGHAIKLGSVGLNFGPEVLLDGRGVLKALRGWIQEDSGRERETENENEQRHEEDAQGFSENVIRRIGVRVQPCSSSL